MELLFLLLTLDIGQIYAQYAPEQKREIDSLEQLLATAKEDTVKIGLRFQIGETGWIFRTSYWDSISKDCILLLEKPDLKDQEKKLYRKSLGNTFNNTGFIYNNLLHTTFCLVTRF